MELIVTGGGSGDNTKEIDCFFAAKLDKTKPLLYIPIAINSIKHPYRSCLSWLKATFQRFGIEKYEIITESTLENFSKRKIIEYSGIYIGGGNTPYLLNKIKSSFIWNFIKDALKENIPIYGGSAGAIIFGKSIISSLLYDKNWNELKDLTGFNVLLGYNITCHYLDLEKEKLKKLIKENKLKNLIALSEKNALYLNNKGMKLIGREKCLILNEKNEEEINTGNYFKLEM